MLTQLYVGYKMFKVNLWLLIATWILLIATIILTLIKR